MFAAVPLNKSYSIFKMKNQNSVFSIWNTYITLNFEMQKKKKEKKKNI